MSRSNLSQSSDSKLSPDLYPNPPSPSSPRPRERVLEPDKAVSINRTPIKRSHGTNQCNKKELILCLTKHFSSTKKSNSNQGKLECNSVESQKSSKSSFEKDNAKFSISSRKLGTPKAIRKIPQGAAFSTPMGALVNHCSGTKATLTPLRPDNNDDSDDEEDQYEQSIMENDSLRIWHSEKALENRVMQSSDNKRTDHSKNDKEVEKDDDQPHEEIPKGNKSTSIWIKGTTKNPIRQRREIGKKEDIGDDEERNKQSAKLTVYDGAKNKSVGAARWVVIKDALPSSFQKGVSSSNRIQERAGVVIQKCVHRTRKIPATLKISAQCVAKVDQVTLLAFTSLMLSFTIQVYPTVPRCDSGLALFVFLHTMTKKNQNSERLLRFILALHVFSVGLDLDWLISDYYPVPINTNQLQSWYQNEYSTVRYVTRCLLVIVIVAKIVVLGLVLRSSTVGTQILSMAWSKVRVFFPVATTGGMTTKEIKDMLNSRVLSLIWLELLVSMTMLILGVYAHARLPRAPQFLLAPTFTSFSNLLYAKAASGVVLVAAILKNCTRSSVASTNETPAIKVLIDQSFLRFNGTLKFFETCLGILLWINLGYAWNLGGSNTPKEVKIVLICLSIAMVLTDCVAGALWITICCHANTSDTFPSLEDEQDVDHKLNFGSNSNDESCEEPSFTPFLSELDDHVSCGRSTFSMKWKLLPPGFQQNFKATRVPTISECEEILQSHKFFAVASGTVNDEIKMFRIARHEGVDILCELRFPSRSDNLRVMLHLKVNPFQSASSARNKFLVGKLPLQQLFGASPLANGV